MAVAENYSTYDRAIEQDIVLHYENGSVFQGVVWPGATVFPDWFAPQTQPFWDAEFASFFSASEGVDIDALWIDMNERTFLNSRYACSDTDSTL